MEYFINYKLDRYEYLKGSKTDKEFTLVIVEAESETEAIAKLKAKKEYHEEGGDGNYLVKYDFIEKI